MVKKIDPEINPQTRSDNHQIVIVGAGPVGCMVALELAENGYSCSIIERQKSMTPANNSFDGRCLALNLHSWDIIKKSMATEPQSQAIKQIRISQQGQFGSALLDSEQMRLNQFGVTVDSVELGEKLHQAVQNHHLIQAYFGVEEVTFENARLTNHIRKVNFQYKKQAQQLIAKVVIAADGTDSTVRQHLNITSKVQDYQQIACIAKIQHEKLHHGLAHERFLKNGVLALLPTALKPIKDNPAADVVHRGYVSSMVLLQPKESMTKYLELSDEQFLNQLQDLFGQRFGRWTQTTLRKTYPMKEVLAASSYAGNSVLIGNASHSLHPIAGQGLNLGLRDISVLMQKFEQHGINTQALEAFNEQQKHDIQLMSQFMNGLLKLFANNQPGMAYVRTIGLKLFDNKPFLKHLFCYYMCGLFPESHRITKFLSPTDNAKWVKSFFDEIKKIQPTSTIQDKLSAAKKLAKKSLNPFLNRGN